MSNQSLSALPSIALTPGNSLESYIHAIHQVPVLSAEEEVELAEKFQKEQDIESARRLVLSHLRFVVKIARGYSGYGLALADLVQEGNIGLMKAVKRFDPSLGVRLVSFAVHWVKAEMHEFIIRNWRIVKVATTKAQRKLFFSLRSAKKRLGWFNREEAQSVASTLGVSTDDLLKMETRLSAQDVTFDPQPEHDDERAHAPSQYLEADPQQSNPAVMLEHNDWHTQRQQQLQNALSSLDARSQDIIQQRWMQEEKATLHELAAQYAVSAERIRQLENNALKKLKQFLHQN